MRDKGGFIYHLYLDVCLCGFVFSMMNEDWLLRLYFEVRGFYG